MGSSESKNRAEDADENGAPANGIAVAAGVVGSVLVGAAGLAWALSSESKAEEKMMKAPGQDHSMRRRDFEEDPKAYFKDLRKK